MMHKVVLFSLALAMTLALMGFAQAASVTWTFEATVVSGPLAGQSGTGTFSYDDANPDIQNQRVLTPSDVQVTFTYDGQTFATQNDSDFDQASPSSSIYPRLSFKREGTGFAPFALDYLLKAGVNGVTFNNSNIASISIHRTYPLEEAPSGSGYDYTTKMIVTLVPVPASLLLLFSALAGFGFVGWRRGAPA